MSPQPDVGGPWRWQVNPCNAEVQITRMKRFLKTMYTLSCWYSLDISHRVLSDEYPCARVLVISSFFNCFVLAKLATSSIRVYSMTQCPPNDSIRLPLSGKFSPLPLTFPTKSVQPGTTPMTALRSFYMFLKNIHPS